MNPLLPVNLTNRVNRRMSVGVVCALALLSACPKTPGADAGSASAADAPSAPARVVAPGPPTSVEQLVADLSLFATGRSLDSPAVKARAEAIATGASGVDGFIDELVARDMAPGFAKRLVVMPIEPKKSRHPVPVHSVLKRFKAADDRNIWYLRDKCEANQAVPVRAWWDDRPTVLVCPSSYKPDVKGDDEGRRCGSSMLDPRDTDVCGCGPALMYCTYGDNHYKTTQSRLWDEVRATTAWVVNNDRPIEELFTMNGTVRGNTAEMLYRRARVGNGEPVDLLYEIRGFKHKQVRPRAQMTPGQHAGILTSPVLVYSSDALRGVMRNYFEWMWCSGVSSSRVTTQAVLDLDVVDLRVGDGWKQLAKMNICTDCHARLDYGMQFFSGYPSSTTGIDFVPAFAHKGEGPLYNTNIKDHRGDAELTPQGFAKLVVAQPEFGECMSRKIVNHVFNGSDTNDDFSAVHDEFERSHKVKPMLRVALRRYAQRELSPAAASPAAAPPAASPPAATAPPVAAAPPTTTTTTTTVALTPSLRRMIDNDCMECHDGQDAVDLDGPGLEREMLARMIDKVGFGAMPMGARGLSDERRRRYVDELAGLLFAQEQDRVTASAFFGHGMRAHSAHRVRAAVGNIRSRTGYDVDPFRPSTIESVLGSDQLTYSPSLAVTSAVSALQMCKQAGLVGDALAACVERASSPRAVIAGKVGNERVDATSGP